MAGKGVRAGGTMNVCIAVLLCFALLGALDEGSGGRLGVLLFCWMTWGLFVPERSVMPVSYTHLRAHETRHDLVCRLLLEKKKKKRV